MVLAQFIFIYLFFRTGLVWADTNLFLLLHICLGAGCFKWPDFDQIFLGCIGFFMFGLEDRSSPSFLQFRFMKEFY